MKLELDPTYCDGRAVCAQLLPELVVLDEWGFPILGTDDVATGFERDRRAVEVPLPLEHLAHEAVVACPRLALRLER